MGTAHLARPEPRAPDHSGFSHPRDVIAWPAMPEDQKRRILMDWLQDEFALIVADNEGMVGIRSPQPERVLHALRALEG